MDKFEKMTVELQIGMRREDNEELFNSVYSQLFGHDPENDTDTDFDFDDDTDEDENFDFDSDIDDDFQLNPVSTGEKDNIIIIDSIMTKNAKCSNGYQNTKKGDVYGTDNVPLWTADQR